MVEIIEELTCKSSSLEEQIGNAKLTHACATPYYDEKTKDKQLLEKESVLEDKLNKNDSKANKETQLFLIIKIKWL